MDKVASLTSLAKSLASTGAKGILGSDAGIPAHEQITRNRNSARTKKGWVKRKKIMEKKADNLEGGEVRQVVKSIVHNIDSPKGAVMEYTRRSLLRKVRKLFGGRKNDQQTGR